MPTPGKEDIGENLKDLLSRWPKISTFAKKEIRKLLIYVETLRI